MYKSIKRIKSTLLGILCFMFAISIACGGGGGSGVTNNNTITQAPSAPQNAQAASGNTKAVISWTNVSGATSYNIYSASVTGVNKNNYTTLTDGAKVINVTSPYNYNNLTNGKTYYFVITAVNTAGESVESSEVNTTPQTGQVPSAPQNVIAVAGDGEATVTWNTVAGATSYNIYSASVTGVNKNNYTTLQDGIQCTNASSPSVHSDLINGKTYFFVVTAVNAYGESVESSESSAILALPGEEAVTAGSETSDAISEMLASSDDDSQGAASGSKELNEALPEVSDALSSAPDTSGSDVPSARKIAFRKLFTDSTTEYAGPVTGPDNTSGWYYKIYTSGNNSWKLWIKSEPAYNFTTGWPTGINKWWWAWTGESGVAVGYKWITEYSIIDGSRTTGSYKFTIDAPATKYAGSWFEGTFDWTNLRNSIGTHTSFNNWKSHWVRENSSVVESFGSYKNTGTYDGNTWSWNYNWYYGTGTTVDPGYTSKPAWPSSSWATTYEGTGLVYWGEGSSYFEDGVWMWEYTSSKFDGTVQTWSHVRPKFVWNSGCMRSLSVVSGNYESTGDAQASKMWEITTMYDTGSYILSPIKYNALFRYRNKTLVEAKKLSNAETYTLIITKNNGDRFKKSFKGSDMTIEVPVDGDALPHINSMDVNPSDTTVNVGQEIKYQATLYDNYGNPALLQPKFTWLSSDANVASIDSTGVAKGLSAGTVTITGKVARNYGFINNRKLELGEKFDSLKNFLSDLVSATATLKVNAVTVLIPTNVTANKGDGQVTINWSSTTGATSYNVYYAAGSIVTKSGSKVSTTNLSKTISGLTNGTLYSFAVSAENTDGESELSQIVSATPSVSGSSEKNFGAAKTVSDNSSINPTCSYDFLFMNNSNAFVTWGNLDSTRGIVFDQSSIGANFGSDRLLYSANSLVGGSTSSFGRTELVGYESTMYIFFPTNANNNALYFIKSTNGGNTFTNPQSVQSKVFSPRICIGANASTLYVIYMSGNDYKFYLISSTNGGASWSDPIQLAALVGEPDAVALGDNLYITYADKSVIKFLKVTSASQSQPTISQPISIDDTNYPLTPVITAYGDNIYIAWTADPYGTGVIYSAKSTNNGETFSQRVKVSTNTNYRAGSPRITVDSNGGIHLAWIQGYIIYSDGYDEMQRFSLFYAYSNDQAGSFTAPKQIAGGEENTNVLYPSIYANNDKVGVAYTQTLNQAYSIKYTLGE